MGDGKLAAGGSSSSNGNGKLAAGGSSSSNGDWQWEISGRRQGTGIHHQYRGNPCETTNPVASAQGFRGTPYETINPCFSVVVCGKGSKPLCRLGWNQAGISPTGENDQIAKSLVDKI